MPESFKQVGGALCLDFVNTVSGRLPNPGAQRDFADQVENEWLNGFGDLLRWARVAKVLDAGAAAALEKAAGANPRQARQVLSRALTLREAIYRTFTAVAERWAPAGEDLETMNGELALARARERLAVQGRRVTWSWEDGASLDRILWPVAQSAATLLTSDEARKVRRCGGEDCHWLFVDVSRNHSRRWCDMAECGNRAKVRRFRRSAGPRPR